MFDETIQKSILKDHDNLRSLIKELEKHSEDDSKKCRDLEMLFKNFADELLAHGKSEENIFYAELVKSSDGEEMPTKIEEGKEEHHILELVVNEMRQIETGSKEWKAKLEVLKENLEHHLKEEETDIIQASKKTFDKEKNTQLSEEFKQEKTKQLQQQNQISSVYQELKL